MPPTASNLPQPITRPLLCYTLRYTTDTILWFLSVSCVCHRFRPVARHGTGVVQDSQCTNMHLLDHQHLILTTKIEEDVECSAGDGAISGLNTIFTAEWHEHKVWLVPLHEVNEVSSLCPGRCYSLGRTYRLKCQSAPKVSSLFYAQVVGHTRFSSPVDCPASISFLSAWSHGQASRQY